MKYEFILLHMYPWEKALSKKQNIFPMLFAHALVTQQKVRKHSVIFVGVGGRVRGHTQEVLRE